MSRSGARKIENGRKGAFPDFQALNRGGATTRNCEFKVWIRAFFDRKVVNMFRNLLFMSLAFFLAMPRVGITVQLVNIAHQAPVVGGSGHWHGIDFDQPGLYHPQNVTDGINASPNNNQGSPITEPDNFFGIWLGKQGFTTGYFVVDLGSPMTIGSFEIFNTRNGPYASTATGDFRITGANSVAFVSSAMGYDISGPTTVLAEGHLTKQTYEGPWVFSGIPDPLVPDIYNSLHQGPFQYLRFDSLSVDAAADKGFPIEPRVGLNELRVFSEPYSDSSAVPEPALNFLLGTALTGLFLFLRPRGCLLREAASARCVGAL